jgi:hypothetical protein
MYSQYDKIDNRLLRRSTYWTDVAYVLIPVLVVYYVCELSVNATTIPSNLLTTQNRKACSQHPQPFLLSNSSIIMTVYFEQVLNQRVSLQFLVEGKKPKFFPGTIKEVSMRKQKRTIRCRHFVEFDDGDTDWIDLGHMESIGGLKWPKAKGRKPKGKKRKSVEKETPKTPIPEPYGDSDATVDMDTPHSAEQNTEELASSPFVYSNSSLNESQMASISRAEKENPAKSSEEQPTPSENSVLRILLNLESERNRCTTRLSMLKSG